MSCCSHLEVADDVHGFVLVGVDHGLERVLQ